MVNILLMLACLQFQLSEKTDPRSVDAVTRKKLQALGRHSNYTCVDKIFGGQLVSTIVCEQCHNSSQVMSGICMLNE